MPRAQSRCSLAWELGRFVTMSLSGSERGRKGLGGGKEGKKRGCVPGARIEYGVGGSLVQVIKTTNDIREFKQG